jgi:hypothetical protein
MAYLVPRLTPSSRTSPGPRNPVPQDPGRLHAQHGYSRPWAVPRPSVGIPASRWCSSPWAVPGAWAAPGHCRRSDAWSVPKRLASALARSQCPSALPAPWPMVGTQSQRQGQAQYQYCGVWSVLQFMVGTHSPWPVRRSTAGAAAHGRCPHRKIEDRRPAPRATRPNMGVQATANSVRSCLAPAVRRA